MAEDRSCIVCGCGGPFVLVFQARAYPCAMVRCPDCGLVFQDPQPSQELLDGSYYQDERFARLLFGELRELTLRRAHRKLALLRAAGLLRTGARLLDVGCSSGAWLEVAAAVGMTGTGVEPGARTSALARSHGLDVRTGTLHGCFSETSPDRFDLITFWDVLEHLRDPRRELALAAGLLAPGGLVAATVPNIAGWYPRVTHRLLTRRTGRWEHPELPVHLYDFNPDTARLLMSEAGLEPVALSTFPTPFDHFRGTSLSLPALGGGPRAVLLRGAFEALKLGVYPAARLCGRQNSLFLAARPRKDSS